MVALGSNSPQLHILLGRAAYDQGDSTRALEELQSALALDKKVCWPILLRCDLPEIGKIAEAQKELSGVGSES